LCAILAIASPNFLTPFNLTVVIREASFVGLVALGQTLVLLLGGIDLSVGAAAGLSAIVGCLFLKSLGIPPWLVIPATALFGLCIGSISGFFYFSSQIKSIYRAPRCFVWIAWSGNS